MTGAGTLPSGEEPDGSIGYGSLEDFSLLSGADFIVQLVNQITFAATGYTNLQDALEKIASQIGFPELAQLLLEAFEGITGSMLDFLPWFINLSGFLGFDLNMDPADFNPISMGISFITNLLGFLDPAGLGNIPIFGDIIEAITGQSGGGLGVLSSFFGALPLGGITELVDTIIQALTGSIHIGDLLTDLANALQNIPGTNVLGAGGIPNVLETFTTMWDNITSALLGSGVTGVGLDVFAAAAQNTSQSANASYTLSTINTATLGIRTNNPVNGALERTTVASFDITQLGTGATPLNFAVDQTHSAIAQVRMPQDDTKGVLYWRSSGDSVTGFYANFGTMALDGTVTHLFQSANLVAQLTSGWQWQQYTFASGDEITHLASENVIVEFIVAGSGTVTIAGLPMAWQTDDHPTATTPRSGATRNTQSLGGTPTLSNTGYTFSGNAPWVGLGRSDVPTGYVPPEVEEFDTPGAFTYNIPAWIVDGDIIDVFAIGSGGGGQSGGYFLPGQGGECGTWEAVSLVYGTDITLGTTTITGNVAASAAGGFNPFVFDSGDNGTSTTVVVTGYGTITAAGGTGGGQSGNGQSSGGQAAGNSPTIDGFTVFGGAAAGVNQAGNAPGGGGGAGYPAVGRASGKGKTLIRARQA